MGGLSRFEFWTPFLLSGTGAWQIRSSHGVLQGSFWNSAETRGLQGSLAEIEQYIHTSEKHTHTYIYIWCRVAVSCVYIYVYIYTSTHTHTLVYTYLYIYVCISIYLSISMAWLPNGQQLTRQKPITP